MRKLFAVSLLALFAVGCKETKPEPVSPKERITIQAQPIKIQPKITSVWVTRQCSDSQFHMVEASGSGLDWEFIDSRVITPGAYMVAWRLESPVLEGSWAWSQDVGEGVIARCNANTVIDTTGMSIRCIVNFYDNKPPSVFTFKLTPVFVDPPTLTVRFWTGDITRDGVVSSNDKAMLKFYYGAPFKHGKPALVDLNMDGKIDSVDKGLLKAMYGKVYTRK